MNVAVIIPAYNEAKHISAIVERTKKIISDVIVVDDGSIDDTAELAYKEGAIILRHLVNLGKGAAAKTGCDYAYKTNHDVLILMDADGQHLPEDIPRFLSALQNKDIVFSYRTSKQQAPFLLRVGNWGLSFLSNILFHIAIYDTQSGFRAFTKKAYRQIRWSATDYAMESEMIYRSRGLRFTQIAIERIYLDNVKGTTVPLGFSIGWQMIKWKFFGGI